MIKINEDYKNQIVDLFHGGIRGSFLYVGPTIDHAMEMKAQVLKAITSTCPSLFEIRRSSKLDIVTDTQRIKFSSTGSVCCGCSIRGISLDIAFLDVDDEDRNKLYYEIVPALVSNSGKII